MMTIKFGTEEFHDIPECYEETNLGRFMEVMKLQNKESEFKSKSLFTAHLIATIIGCEVEYILELDSNEIGQLAKAFSWLSKTPPVKKINKLELDGIVYGLKENMTLKVGEQVSIETFLQKDLSNTDSFHIVMAILLRPMIEKKDVYTGKTKQDLKPLEDNFNEVLERAELFKNKLMISDIYGALSNFSNGVKKSSTKTSVASSRLKIVRGNKK